MARRAKVVPGITTCSLSLCDEQGRLRGVLSTTRLNNGDPSLRLYDAKERERIVVEIDGEVAKVVMVNEDGTTAVAIGCNPGSGNSVSLFDQHGLPVCQVSAGIDGERRVRMFDKTATPIHDQSF